MNRQTIGRMIGVAAILAMTVPFSAAYSAKIMTKKGMLTLYAGQKFTGDYMEVVKDRTSMSTDFTIGSIAVFEGEKWEVCEGQRFKEPCMIVTQNTENLGEIMIKSARKVVDAPAS
jgi:hypothetical protein